MTTEKDLSWALCRDEYLGPDWSLVLHKAPPQNWAKDQICDFQNYPEQLQLIGPNWYLQIWTGGGDIPDYQVEELQRVLGGEAKSSSQICGAN